VGVEVYGGSREVGSKIPEIYFPSAGKFVHFWADCLLAEVAPKPTQPSNPPGSVNEDQLRLGRQRQVWFILFVYKRVGLRVKL